MYLDKTRNNLNDMTMDDKAMDKLTPDTQLLPFPILLIKQGRRYSLC